MEKYLVVRHGSNGANQHLKLRMVVGAVAAADADSARAEAEKLYSLCRNQHFELIPLSGRTLKADREAAAKEEARRALYQPGE